MEQHDIAMYMLSAVHRDTLHIFKVLSKGYAIFPRSVEN